MEDLDLEKTNHQLQDMEPEDILKWAAERFSGNIAASSSFQTQSLPLLHLISQTCPEVPVFFVDTGFHFPETLEFRDALCHRWGLQIKNLKPREPVTRDHRGMPLYRVDPDLCCFHNKVNPMNRALEGLTALISGIRGDQTEHRRGMRVLEHDRNGLLRIHPIIGWTKKELWAYIDRHQLPEHPLFSKGYLSIGCQPCTRTVFAGDDERAGRWAGSGKTECGLHLNIVSKKE